MRFTVGYCLYPHGENNSIETRMRLIFDDGLPATELNRHLVMAQLNRDKPLGTTVYQLCIYLNYLDMRGLEAVNATMDNLYNFLCELYIDGLPHWQQRKPSRFNRSRRFYCHSFDCRHSFSLFSNRKSDAELLRIGCLVTYSD